MLIHFFLFCNVFRIRRNLELIWAAIFVTSIAICSTVEFPLLMSFAIQLPVSITLILVADRSNWYHGIFASPRQIDDRCDWCQGEIGWFPRFSLSTMILRTVVKVGSNSAVNVPLDRSSPYRCPLMLIDTFGRLHTSLRVSVTDRCNLRCTYCMPAETPDYESRTEILTFEEIERFVRIAVELGVDDVRLTGGEPLVRAELHKLVGRINAIDGIRRMSMTTNGVLLEAQLDDLFAAGLRSVNVSLDALDAASFREATRRPGLDKVLSAITAARKRQMKVKINAIALRGFTERHIEAFGHFARETKIPIRFIEFMPLDTDGTWDSASVLTGAEILARFSKAIRPLVPLTSNDSPATDYQFDDGLGTIGVIPSVSEPFCDTCNRFRLTADGQLRNCLFGEDSGDVRVLLRNGSDDAAIADRIRSAVSSKKAGHGTDDLTFLRPTRPMYSIGG
ncbi:GTP 3',8-cyclase MoaA [Novipirellula herctigrandis]|uniref:GTP 3',8-cyclase MoaA n=1 Tax=Novipirellula herctigrandis TaxID=2527986 RepID=UPI003AF36F54